MAINLKQKKILYQGYATLEQWQLTDEGIDKTVEVLQRGDSTALLPFDKERQEILLVEQFRPGSYPQTERLLELIAGIIDKGETSSEAIIREAKEEAHLQVQQEQLINLGTFYLSPGMMSERTTLYLSPADLSQVTHLSQGGIKEEGENIRLIKMPFDKAWGYLNQPKNINITMAYALNALRMFYPH